MVRKKLAVAILALSALQAGIAGAMGLGNLSVKSALNQPLNAEIKLIETGDLDPSQIKIRLASQEDFQRAGVDRDFFLTNLRFDVNMDGKGGGTIRITTREPVIEPYLNFVIEARWPNGRLLREFAVLLDPPTFSDNKAMAPVASATTTGAPGVKSRAVQPPTVTSETEVTKSAPPADMSLPAAEKSGEYRVQVYDTLSKIAARFKPANDVSVAQTMIAIQRANPNVFIRNNINLIKSGYVLRLPSADEARAITAEQAAQDVDTQMQEWRGARSSGAAAAKAATGPQLDASAPEPSAKEGGYREQARLSIATAGDSNKGGSGGGSGKGVDALRQQLTESQEALEKGKRDNKELQSRLDDMERQIATLQRLITLKDEQLAALQTKSAGAKPAAQPVPAPEAEKPAATEPSVAATPTPAPAPEAAAPAPAPVPKPAPVKPAALPAKPQPTPESGLASKLIADPAYLYGGIGALLLALFSPFVFKRLKKREEEVESDTLSFDEGDRFHFDTGAFEEPQAESEETFEAAAEDVAQPAAEAPQKAVRSETGDPIAESDIYIAYGRYQQAVDLLTTAIDAEPARSDLRTKLLEVYVEMRNKDAFRQQFVALQGLGDSGAVAHVKDLLSSVDGISDWLDDLPGTSMSSAATTAATFAQEASAEPDLDLDLEFDTEAVAEQSTERKAGLDMDFGGDVEALESSFAAELGTTNEENPLELDLDLDQESFAGDL
ncbi:MAG TPA: FimV/HubP family polar landmark protein, partial [Spongiibacteraceae bacterium]|nr:FimV/HubP family polar landmark protein [Spongiibacteraceae bacterium]